MNIPECRDELRSIIARLRVIEKEMYRRPAVRRARVEHAPLTAARKRRIRAFAKANPKMSYAKIGKYFNVGIGRVSEALAGKRR